MRQMLLAMAVAASTMIVAPKAHAAPPPVEAYARTPQVSELQLSPSGKRAAFVVTNTAGRRIVAQDVGGKVLVTVDPGPAKLDYIAWAGDDHLLIATYATVNLGADYAFKHDLTKVQALDVRTAKVMNVFEKTKAVANVVFGYYGSSAKDGHAYGYFGGVTLEAASPGETGHWIHGYPDLYQVDLDSGDARMTAHGDERDHVWVVGADGEVVATSTYRQQQSLWRLHPGAGDSGKELMTVTTALDEISLEGQGHTPGTVLVDDATGEEEVMEEVSLQDGKAQPVFGDHTIRSYIYDPKTRLLLGAEVLGPDKAVLFDPALQAKVNGAFKAFPGRNVRLVSWSPGLDQMIVRTDGADDSGTYWYVDIPGHSATPLGQARPDVPSAAVGATRMYGYKASDGLALDGVLTLPLGGATKGLPLIMMPHGGPLGINDEIGFDWWAQAYASRGYAVFQPNYRGSGGHGLEFMRKGYGEWGRKMLSDMADGVKALAADGTIDPKRVCIVGGSYGGYAALAGVTLQHGLYRCAVSVAGVSDLPALRRYDLDRTGDQDTDTIRYWKTAIQGEAKDDPGLAAISPVNHAGEADAPVLLIHGKDDTVVPIEQSRKMQAALKGAGKPVQLIEMPSQDHALADEATRIQMLQASVDFVVKNNPPG